MPRDLAGVERFLGVLGTAFRLSRLYPSTHPAMVESLGHVATTLPAVAALGSVDLRIGAHSLHWEGQQLVARNVQVSEIAGLLYARGLRTLQIHPGLTIQHVVALFSVARGAIPFDDASLGQLVLTGRRTGAIRHAAIEAPPPRTESASPPAPLEPRVTRASMIFRPDVVPLDVEVRRAVAALHGAEDVDARRAAVARLGTLAPDLRASKDFRAVADVIRALDHALGTTEDSELVTSIEALAETLTDRELIERMVYRLGEPQVAPAEREALVAALGAIIAVSEPFIFAAYQTAAPPERATYRAVVRHAGERAPEVLGPRLESGDPAVIAAAAELVGTSGSPRAVPLLVALLRHPSPHVREAAARGLGEIGGREISRPLMPVLKDDSAEVRAAAARAIGLGGDPAAGVVLTRWLDHEEDEGVQAELLRALGRLGTPEALAVLARFAEPGAMLRRRSPGVRAAAIEGLRQLPGPEAKAVVQLYSHDKEPAVRQAAMVS